MYTSSNRFLTAATSYGLQTSRRFFSCFFGRWLMTIHISSIEGTLLEAFEEAIPTARNDLL